MFPNLRKFIDQRRVISIIAIIFIVYGTYATVRVISRNYKLQQEVDELQEEVELLDLQNKELEYRIAYYRTDAFIDKEARDKLGLQAPGEHVVIFSDKIPRELNTPKTKEQIAAEQSFSERSLSNLDQWLYFLFKKQPK